MLGGRTIELDLSRQGAIGAATQQISCGGGTIEHDSMGFVTHVVDDCAEIVVSGSAAMLIAENVETLTFTGVGNTVYVADVGTVIMDEDSSINTVIYGGDAPSLDDSSVGSVVVHESQTVVRDE